MAYTTIDDPGLFFTAFLYSGDASTSPKSFHAKTGVGFQPDFTWHKSRTSGSNWHGLADSARGVDADPGCKAIYSNSNSLEGNSTDEYLDGYQSDGFKTGENGSFGAPSNNYVAWCWKAGTTSGITTNGSTNVTPSAYTFNQTSKFSALKYAGNGNTDNQVAHGIGSKPDFMMIKNLDGSINSWAVFHKAAGNEKYFELDVTNTMADGINRWQDTDPDTVNFTTGNSDTVNNSSYNYICYAFSEIQGYSKFSSYIGNASTDGTFVYTGFKPAWVMLKRTDSAGGWYIYDNKRAGYNGSSAYLQANSASADDTNAGNFGFDFLSNGFKLKGTYATVNASGGNYIYMAFAEAPFVNSSGVPNNAR
jgi:hypothetical protein